MIREFQSSYPSRYYFERAASLFKEMIEHERIHFSTETPRTVDSIKKVRMLPNGRLNLLTIDELVRSNLHMMNSDMMDKMYETTK